MFRIASIRSPNHNISFMHHITLGASPLSFPSSRKLLNIITAAYSAYVVMKVRMNAATNALIAIVAYKGLTSNNLRIIVDMFVISISSSHK